jgi:aryl-alcohol dehydrogenase-like predicted oxidoreductase
MGVLTGKYTDASNPPAGTRASSQNVDMMEDYFTQPILDAVQRLKPLAQESNCTMSQLALAWCLRQRAVTSVIVGATKREHVIDNAAAGDLDIDPSVFTAMDRILGPLAPVELYLS